MTLKEFKIQAFLAALTSTSMPSTESVPYGNVADQMDRHVRNCMTVANIATKTAKDNDLLEDEEF